MHKDWIKIGNVRLRKEGLTLQKAKRYDSTLTEDKLNELLKKKKIVILAPKDEKENTEKKDEKVNKHKSKFDKK